MLRMVALLFSLSVACLAASQGFSFTVTGRLMLSMMPDVKKELKITKEQDKKIQGALSAMQKGLAGGTSSAPMMMPKGFDAILDDVLDPDQKKRLEELFLQANGGWALSDKRVAEYLVLTEDQVGQVQTISAEGNQVVMGMMSSIRSTGDAKKMKEKKAEFGDKLKALLTPEQKAKFEEGSGKPFKFKHL